MDENPILDYSYSAKILSYLTGVYELGKRNTYTMMLNRKQI